MSEPKQNRNVFDNEYDNDTWTEKEISLSSKVLVALGGITSLGGMIPLIIKNLSQSLFDFNVGPGFFVIFTIVYFGLPLVILIAWSQFTNRIVSPTGKDNNGENNGETKWRHFKRFPVTYRYKKLIWIHVLLIAIYLIFAIYLPNAYLLLWLSPLLFISIAIAIWSFTKRSYSNKKIKVSWVQLFASGIILVFLITISVIYARDIKKTLDLQGVETDLENADYEKIAYVEETSDRLAHIEDDLVNEIDRFYILSGMNAWNILSGQMTGFEDSVDLTAFKIDSTIAILNTFLINDNITYLPPLRDVYVAEKVFNRPKSISQNDYIKYFLPHNPFCQHHKIEYHIPHKTGLTTKSTNQKSKVNDAQYFNQLFLDVQIDRTSYKHHKDGIDYKMGIVNDLIDNMLAHKRHRLYPDCFSHLIISPNYIYEKLKSDNSKLNCSGINAIADRKNVDLAEYKFTILSTHYTYNALPKKDTCTKYILKNMLQKKSSFSKAILSNNKNTDTLLSINLSENLKAKLAATMNRYNSGRFKDWLETNYLPYAQRKAAQEIQKIGEETEWIWKEIKYMGIIISFATLLLLTLQYLELYDLKNYIINTQILPLENTISPEEKENAKSRISDLNNKANYLLFPLTTTLTIVAVLLIPVTTKTELVNIEPTKSFRMLQVPSLKIPKAVESAVNIEGKEKEKADSDLKQLQEEIAKLSQEINELSKSIENLKIERTVGDDDNSSNNLAFEKSQKQQTEQLETRINTLEDALAGRIETLEKKIAEVKKAVDNSKRR